MSKLTLKKINSLKTSIPLCRGKIIIFKRPLFADVENNLWLPTETLSFLSWWACLSAKMTAQPSEHQASSSEIYRISKIYDTNGTPLAAARSILLIYRKLTQP